VSIFLNRLKFCKKGCDPGAHPLKPPVNLNILPSLISRWTIRDRFWHCLVPYSTDWSASRPRTTYGQQLRTFRRFTTMKFIQATSYLINPQWTITIRSLVNGYSRYSWRKGGRMRSFFVLKKLKNLMWRPRRLDNTRSRTRDDKRLFTAQVVAVLSPWPRGQFCRINLIEHHWSWAGLCEQCNFR